MEDPSKEVPPSAIIFIFVLASAFIISINLLIVAVIAKKRKLKKFKSNIFLIIHFTANSMMGMFFVTSAVVVTSGLGGEMVLIPNLSILVSLCTFYAIAGLSGDRLMAINYPMIYQRTSNRFTFAWAVLSVILISLTILANLLNATIISFVIFTLCCVPTGMFVCMSNLKIRQVIKMKFRRVGDHQVTTTMAEEQKTMELKKTRICLVLAFSFLVFWMPAIVMSIVEKILSRFFDYDYSVVKFIGMTMALMNSIFDPVFYIIRSKKLRDEIKDCVLCRVSVEGSN